MACSSTLSRIRRPFTKVKMELRLDFCTCGREMKPDTVRSVVDSVLALPEETRFYVAFPLRFSDLVTDAVVVENLSAQGFLRVSVDGNTLPLDDLAAAEPPRACRSRS